MGDGARAFACPNRIRGYLLCKRVSRHGWKLHTTQWTRSEYKYDLRGAVCCDGWGAHAAKEQNGTRNHLAFRAWPVRRGPLLHGQLVPWYPQGHHPRRLWHLAPHRLGHGAEELLRHGLVDGYVGYARLL